MPANRPSTNSIAGAEVVSHWLTQSRLSGFSVSRMKRAESASVGEDINRQLADIQSQIRAAMTLLLELQAQRSGLLTVLDLVNNLGAPIRMLPIEILSTIFYYCVSSTKSIHKGGVFDAIRIASVCSSWRTIALGDSRLWTDLFIQSMWQSVAADEMECDMLQTIQLRSGTSPLSLSVVGGMSAVIHQPVTLTVLRNLAPRCTKLVLLDMDDTHYHSLMLSADGFRPSTLAIENELRENSFDLDTITFKSTVRTLRVTLRDGLYNGEWENLNSLDIGHTGHENTLPQRLPSCSSLQSLTLRFSNHADVQPLLISESIVLLELIIPSPSSCDPDTMFRGAILPKLHHLVIQGDWTSWGTCSHHRWHEAVKSLTLTSKCVLTSLSIAGMYGTDCCLIKLLEVLPSLRDFVFIPLAPGHTVETQSFKDLFRRLTFPSFAQRAMGDPLCRYLTNLQLELNVGYFEEAALANMIISRLELLPYQQMWGWSKLQNIVVSVKGVASAGGSLQSLTHLRDSGKLTLMS
ncbi:hypothetical protein K435DRAFT_862931 [Dendrothele bispora CBS 962.96]|uniref:F-box domain-containing protein n=1 Tax=Dendrothele bispora (strain CBS 962.96) TaxID=1314807 RepID=A0A4S8LR75_DENBC|nr:hypothetical protein K435DRAFT_862931 [Dendrothele bispora CBS 962.96]